MGLFDAAALALTLFCTQAESARGAGQATKNSLW
jgi:hypothetical protein